MGKMYGDFLPTPFDHFPCIVQHHSCVHNIAEQAFLILRTYRHKIRSLLRIIVFRQPQMLAFRQRMFYSVVCRYSLIHNVIWYCRRGRPLCLPVFSKRHGVLSVMFCLTNVRATTGGCPYNVYLFPPRRCRPPCLPVFQCYPVGANNHSPGNVCSLNDTFLFMYNNRICGKLYHFK